ncbi:hypothetical protein CALCODRAFT_79565 [Calocera cornea HHB12733]|uniref:Uncharacterized protein n=1 Tax=Calocera cornea HHB12733 TaxID=1353952 RepID=A0A165DFC3_9BASI|nr:hypothetical protein CALCODRAFT_79565 [Calocera cornea HHB12733]
MNRQTPKDLRKQSMMMVKMVEASGDPQGIGAKSADNDVGQWAACGNRNTWNDESEVDQLLSQQGWN